MTDGPKKLVIPPFFKYARYWEMIQLCIIAPLFITCCILNISCTIWLLMAMILNWIAVVLPIGDTTDSYDRLIKTCIKKNLKKKKRSQINYKMVQDLYDKYKEQTDLRIGVGIGYLVFLLIPIWLEW